MTLEQFTDQALSAPFLDKGRSMEGWDCWGLIIIAYKKIKNVDLPSYLEYTSAIKRDELDSLIKERKNEYWEEIKKPKALDTVLLYLLGKACHIGLMLDATHFLHVQKSVLTYVDNVNSSAWRGRGYDKIEGFYRYVD